MENWKFYCFNYILENFSLILIKNNFFKMIRIYIKESTINDLF